MLSLTLSSQILWIPYLLADSNGTIDISTVCVNINLHQFAIFTVAQHVGGHACGKFSCFKEFPSPQRCNKAGPLARHHNWTSGHVATAKAQESLNSEGTCTSTIRKLAARDAARVATSNVKTMANSAVRRPV